MLIMLILPCFASHWKVAVIRYWETGVGMSFNHLIMSSFSQALAIITTTTHPSVAGDPKWFQTVNQAFAAWIAAFFREMDTYHQGEMTLSWSNVSPPRKLIWSFFWNATVDIFAWIAGLWKAEHVLGCWNMEKASESEVSVSKIQVI